MGTMMRSSSHLGGDGCAVQARGDLVDVLRYQNGLCVHQHHLRRHNRASSFPPCTQIYMQTIELHFTME